MIKIKDWRHNDQIFDDIAMGFWRYSDHIPITYEKIILTIYFQVQVPWVWSKLSWYLVLLFGNIEQFGKTKKVFNNNHTCLVDSVDLLLCPRALCLFWWCKRKTFMNHIYWFDLVPLGLSQVALHYSLDSLV